MVKQLAVHVVFAQKGIQDRGGVPCPFCVRLKTKESDHLGFGMSVTHAHGADCGQKTSDAAIRLAFPLFPREKKH